MIHLIGMPKRAFNPIKIFSLILISTLSLLNSSSVSGQELPAVTDPTGLFGTPPPITQEKVPASPPASPMEILPPAPAISSGEGNVSPLKLFVKEVKVVGSTVLTPEELAEVTTPFLNRDLTTEELENIRLALTQLYVNKGYITSGAILPDQSVSDGVITFQMIEGKLSEIIVEGTNWFLPSYFTSRLSLYASPPINLYELRDRLQLFLQDERIAQINSELRPGVAPGTGILHLRVEETNPWGIFLEFNNFQSPTIGAESGNMTISGNNLLGLGDRFVSSFSKSTGIDLITNSKYTIPISPWDTLFSLRFRLNKFKVTEDPFESLNIRIDSKIYGISLRQPIFRDPFQELYLELAAEHIENKNSLMSQNFPFIPGTGIEGKTRISALRLSQVWLKRAPASVIRLESTFNFGLDVLNATVHSSSSRPDSHYFTWIGHAHGAYQFDPTRILLIGRMSFQIANDRLLPLEQFAMGGRFSVRGYRENTLVRDNAFLFTVESRIPILSTIFDKANVQFAPFIDVGRSWNAKGHTPAPKTIASIGVGFRFSVDHESTQLLKSTYASIYWGQQINHVSNPKQNLQDHGIHLQLGFDLL